MAARLGVVTGQGLSDLIRDRFGVRWTVFAMLVLLSRTSPTRSPSSRARPPRPRSSASPRYIAVPVVAVAIWALVLFASYRTVERIFLPVALVFVTYIAAAILAPSRLGRRGPGARHPVARSLAGHAAADGRRGRHDDHAVHAVLPPDAVAEKGIGEEELRLEQADAVVGSFWTNVIAIFIVVATASTIFVYGRPDHARPPMPRWASRRSPDAGDCCSRSACSGRPCWPRRSCRSAPRT